MARRYNYWVHHGSGAPSNAYRANLRVMPRYYRPTMEHTVCVYPPSQGYKKQKRRSIHGAVVAARCTCFWHFMFAFLGVSGPHMHVRRTDALVLVVLVVRVIILITVPSTRSDYYVVLVAVSRRLAADDSASRVSRTHCQNAQSRSCFM